jgi:hypothetical protein
MRGAEHWYALRRRSEALRGRSIARVACALRMRCVDALRMRCVDALRMRCVDALRGCVAWMRCVDALRGCVGGALKVH